MLKRKNEEQITLPQSILKKFEKTLQAWENNIQSEHRMQIDFEKTSEEVDIANRETMVDLMATQSTRNLQTLNEINNALKKIREGNYGICEESGEPITLKRLEANPIARYSIEAQKSLEKFKS